ncbi:hypothetical protein QBC32DRAFT_327404 [Pseudoneurospora amorphoporcata]|uniref:Uncharacterized protein n=1 Tax=Pseudoneurospora amorphoporcata TaxID=241081 RepID=A0AAN6SDF0_9PEZI|nr:hypothetical protein QBC32DRAFT_327404 [Pseudoneurospora amorphoporcata]
MASWSSSDLACQGLPIDHLGRLVRRTVLNPYLPPPFIGDYAASKAGVHMLHERGAPEWVLRMARESTVKIPVDFKGRQVVDVETGVIKLEDHGA